MEMVKKSVLDMGGKPPTGGGNPRNQVMTEKQIHMKVIGGHRGEKAQGKKPLSQPDYLHKNSFIQ